MQWIISENIRVITQEYVMNNMPKGTTSIQFPIEIQIGFCAFEGLR